MRPVPAFQTMPLLACLIPETEGMQVGPNILVFTALGARFRDRVGRLREEATW